MSDQLQTSKEILDAFFDELSRRKGLHKPTVDILVELYRQNKLTKTNVSNALIEAREEKGRDEDQ